MSITSQFRTKHNKNCSKFIAPTTPKIGGHSQFSLLGFVPDIKDNKEGEQEPEFFMPKFKNASVQSFLVLQQ